MEEIAPTGGSCVDGDNSTVVSAATGGLEHLPLDTDNDFIIAPDEPLFGTEATPDEVVSDNGEISDTATNKQEKSKEMSYCETARSIRAFMGWNHILDVELEYTDPDKSNNTWRGKNLRSSFKIFVEMPVDDWLCQK